MLAQVESVLTIGGFIALATFGLVIASIISRGVDKRSELTERVTRLEEKVKYLEERRGG
jgi:hypothetical protein